MAATALLPTRLATRRRVTVRRGERPAGFGVCGPLAWRITDEADGTRPAHVRPDGTVSVGTMADGAEPGSTTSGGTTSDRAVDEPAGSPECSGRVEIVHSLTAGEISDDVMVSALERLVTAGILRGQREFEAAAVGLIRSAADDEATGWAAFYDNSLRELQDGRARFAPVHQRARSLVGGHRVLEVGCCFGFLALQCADAGHRVAACDISAGAVDLLTRQARRRGAAVDAVVGDATALPFGDDAVDTVTLVHLLEHLDETQARGAIREALRVARHRVVVAVPYEEHPSAHFGHLVRLTAEDLHRWARSVTHGGARTFADHGGWLVLTPPGAR